MRILLLHCGDLDQEVPEVLRILNGIKHYPGEIIRGEELIAGNVLETWDIGYDSYRGLPPSFSNHAEYEAGVIMRTTSQFTDRKCYDMIFAGQNPLTERLLLALQDYLSLQKKTPTIMRLSMFYGQNDTPHESKARDLGYRYDFPKRYIELWYFLGFLGEHLTDTLVSTEAIDRAVQSFNKAIVSAKTPVAWQPIRTL